MGRGTVVAESIRVGSEVTDLGVTLRSIERVRAADASAGQPTSWTLLRFEVDDQVVPLLAERLSTVLDRRGGWYCDLATNAQTFVVFAGRVFRYERGSARGRDEAKAYGRTIGVPDSQLDWPV